MKIETKLDRSVVQYGLLIVFLILLLRTAWVSDDAYITLRTISNFARGQGLTWNVGERVQSYTHPLWLLTLGLGVFFTKEFHLTTIFISVAVSALAFLLLTARLSRPGLPILLAGVILVHSRAFIDYSTSGLENPLSNLLLVLFSIRLFGYQGSTRGLFLLGFLASLAFLTRPDNVLVFYPALAAAFVHDRSRKHFRMLLLSQLPAIAWEAFSLLYYGLAVPNTALAKLNVGIPAAVQQTGFDRILIVPEGFGQ